MAIVRWLTHYGDRFAYGRPDPTINLESLPKPTSRVLIHMYRAKIILENERAWATDVLLSRLLTQLQQGRSREEMLMATALSDVYTGQHASRANLDRWEASDDPQVQKNAQLVSKAISWFVERIPDEWTIEVREAPESPLRAVTERVWLEVPADPMDDELDWRSRSPREIQRARREMARSLHRDFFKQAEAEGLNGSANRQAVEKTAEVSGYSMKEIYKILSEVRL